MNPEYLLEKILISSRWLLCPLYFGLAVLPVLFSIFFARELYHLATNALTLREEDLIVAALTLVDLTLVAGLVVMVMLSSYENFVSKLDITEAAKNIAWLGKLDTGTLKLKVSASLVAISAVRLLKAYMEIDTTPNDKLVWLTIIHLTFVVSAVLLTVMDRLLATGERH